ncbi:phage tail domain-containing protein [Paenibacillus paeoniae]|uniref:Phage tail-like C-terminal domain-containing protein n=1 Tax=Paenibacillus paeoniae TaxID=2292705 RepID=A0A371PJB6_9BACL|nr:phage tail domain-containing protein [Paenibacillus paeoniae]REK76301.1 hypothetical protein DX130_04445 [Paenibacillus paeoniae]
MLTWLDLFGMKGYYQSEPIALHVDGDGAINHVQWSCIAPADTSVIVLTSISFDGGYDWSEWRQAVNGGSIPDIQPYTPIGGLMLRYRVFLSTTDSMTTPMFEDITFTFEPVIVLDNKGDTACKPEIWMTTSGAGDFSLINTSNRNKEFKIKQLNNNETVYINNELEYIESDLPMVYRYSNFNDQYMTLPQGKNIFRVKGNAKVQFRYQFKLI